MVRIDVGFQSSHGDVSMVRAYATPTENNIETLQVSCRVSFRLAARQQSWHVPQRGQVLRRTIRTRAYRQAGSESYPPCGESGDSRMKLEYDPVQPDLSITAQLSRISDDLRKLARVQAALRKMFRSVLGSDVSLREVLHLVATAAMDLVDARYGALSLFSEDGDSLAEFVPVGLTEEEEEAAAASLGSPSGRGLLGHLMVDPRPLRVASISEHPAALGLPPGHPQTRTLLAVGISSRRRRAYGNLFVSERRDGQPFDEQDESMIVALAGAAELAIDDARLFAEVRSEAEEFQRLLLPRLPDLGPIEAAAVYRSATAGPIGGDWYDAIRLPDDTYAVVIGDVGGHSLQAAAAMAETRSMLRALLHERQGLPGVILTQLDRTLQAITDTSFTTVCLAKLRPADEGWSLRWSTAGHPAPLLLPPGEPARYLTAQPGPPLGVDSGAARPELHERLPGGSTLVFFTDGLVEDRRHPIDKGLAALAAVATNQAGQPPGHLCRAFTDNFPGDGSDDTAILVLHLPA